MAEEDPDHITDVEAFHQELLGSVGRVREMVLSWLPPSAEIERIKNFDDRNVNLESLRSRPERLGLGATPASSKTSAAALANTNSAEGRMLKSLLQGGKRKAEDEPESSTSARRTNANGSAFKSTSLAQAGSDSEEEESRTKSFSTKGKGKAGTAHDFFHDKPAKPSQTNGAVQSEEATLKKKSKKRKSEALQNGVPAASAEDTFVKPTTPNKQTPSAPASPARSTTSVKPPYALPPSTATPDADKPELEDSADDESIVTDTTMTSTIAGSPTTGDGEQKKKKRKKKKKNKNKGVNSQAEPNTPFSTANSGMLFGSSILD